MVRELDPNFGVLKKTCQSSSSEVGPLLISILVDLHFKILVTSQTYLPNFALYANLGSSLHCIFTSDGHMSTLIHKPQGTGYIKMTFHYEGLV
jgi:hypothetical protein